MRQNPVNLKYLTSVFANSVGSSDKSDEFGAGPINDPQFTGPWSDAYDATYLPMCTAGLAESA